MENAIHIEFKSPSGSEVKLKEEEYIGPPSVWTSKLTATTTQCVCVCVRVWVTLMVEITC